jgi:hypothetical protein
MHSHRRPRRRSSLTTVVAVGLPLAVASSLLAAPALAKEAPSFTWTTVANSATVAPPSAKSFNSFNQPSVNTSGLVVFRARAKGPQPFRGVFTRNAVVPGSAVIPVATVDTEVPQPNNLEAQFNEFPSFPRISKTGAGVATRGQSSPVWEYTLAEGTDTRIGTSGVYATVGGALTTGASLLGAVPGYEVYAVPGAAAGTRFDQFPGAPSIDGSTIAFKGNYTEGGGGKTGVYYRNLSRATNPVVLVANTATRIPNQPAKGTATFGSTAPPSAAGGRMVFLGLDDEDNPTMGGIYLARTNGTPKLQTLVSIGTKVPGQGRGDRFNALGESLSFDGRFVSFWGAWGTATQTITLQCATDGNADVLAYCNEQYPQGFTTTVPVHQGVFVYDTAKSELRAVATTGTQFGGFLYWVYSGHVPEGGDDSLEGPRWRSSAFTAVTSSGSDYQVAFKATPVAGGSGIYLGPGSGHKSVLTVVDTSTAGTSVDAAAPAGSMVSAVGLERDGFRGRYLALSISMLDSLTSESWAGVYLTRAPKNLDD